MLACVRLAQDAPDNLLHIDFAGTVGKRCQNIGKGAVPAFFKRIDRNDVPNRAAFAHQVYALQLVYIGGLDRNLVVRYANVCQFFSQPLKGSAVLFASGLRLKQNDRADIAIGLAAVQCLLLQIVAQINSVKDHVVLALAVIHHNRQFYHILAL